MLQAPWAPLVALGIKRYETRGFRPSGTLALGDDLAIVLGRSPEGVRALPGDCEGGYEGGWLYGYVGTDAEYQAGYCIHTSAEGTRGDVFLDDLAPHRPPAHHEFKAGTVLAVVTYGGAIPIIDEELGWCGKGDTPDVVLAVGDPGELHRISVHWEDDIDLADQIPWGVYTPGRYAWELTNVRRLADPVPCPARQLDGTPISMQSVFELPDHVDTAVAQQITSTDEQLNAELVAHAQGRGGAA